MRFSLRRSSAATVAVVAVLAIGVPPTPASPVQAAAPSPAGTEVLFSIPIGDTGVGMSPGGDEQEAWGPAAMTVDAGGTVWIADSVASRLVGYARDGRRTDVINLAEKVIGIGDLDVRGESIVVLDYSAERVLLVDRTKGTVDQTIDLPDEFGLAAGLSGVSFAPNGDITIEFAGGASTARLADAAKGSAAQRAGRPIAAGRFIVAERADSAKVRSSARVAAGRATIDIQVAHRLGGVYLAGERAASFDVIVDEASQEASGTVRVDRTIRRFDWSGAQVAIGRVPLQERATYVANGIVALPNGDVLALMPRTDRVDVVRVIMRTSAPDILPSGFVAPATQTTASTTGNVGVLSCRDRRIMDNVRFGYTSLRTNLNNANKNGACAGRMKPRSFGIVPFPGVTYDWGGWQTVAQWSANMTNNKVAGDINTTSEACDYGVDCLGLRPADLGNHRHEAQHDAARDDV